MQKSGLPPVVDENTETLIFGTLPSDMSIAAQHSVGAFSTPGMLHLWPWKMRNKCHKISRKGIFEHSRNVEGKILFNEKFFGKD